MGKDQKNYINGKFMCAVLSSGFGAAFQHGYHLAIINPSSDVLIKWISTCNLYRYGVIPSESHVLFLWEITSCIYQFGGIFGALISCPIAKKYGVKKGLQFINILCLVALFSLTIAKYAKSFELLIIGRLLIGICSGVNSSIYPNYLIEIAPVAIRGSVGLIYPLFSMVSILVSNFMGWNRIFGNDTHWPMMFAICFIPVVFQTFMMRFFPESPIDTYIKYRDNDEAEESLAWYRDSWDIAEEFEEIKREAEIQDYLPKVTFSSMFHETVYRTPLVVTVVLMTSQQWGGIDTILFYSNQIFAEIGIHRDKTYIFSVGGMALLVVVTIIVMFVIDILGRRVLLICSYVGMASVSVILGILFLQTESYNTNRYLIIGLSMVLLGVYALGVGGIPWFLPAEIYPFKARPLGAAMAAAMNWFANFIFVLTATLFENQIGRSMFFVYTVTNTIYLIFCITFVPELKRKSFVDIIKIYHYDIGPQQT